MKTSYISLLFLLASGALLAQNPLLTASTYSGCSDRLISFTLKTTPNANNNKAIELVDDNFGSIGYVIQSSVNDSIYVGTITLQDGIYKPHCFVYIGSKREKVEVDKSVAIKHAPSARFTIATVSGLDSISQKSEISLQLSHGKKEDSITSVKYVIEKTFNTRGARVDQVIDSVETTDYKLAQKVKLGPGKYLISCNMQTAKKELSCFIGTATSYAQEFSIGHLASIKVVPTYLGYDSKVFDSAFYWQSPTICQITGDIFNYSCINRTPFFQLPDSCVKRKIWYRSVKNYKGPLFKEKMLFDFDGDGTIDGEPNTLDTFPRQWRHTLHKYSSSGQHNSIFWTRDSLGYWQKDSVMVEVEKLDLNPKFPELPTDTFMTCLPKMVVVELDDIPTPFKVKKTFIEVDAKLFEYKGFVKKMTVPVGNSGVLRGTVTLLGPDGLDHIQSFTGPHVVTVESDFDFAFEDSKCDTGMVTLTPRDYNLVDEFVWSFGGGSARVKKFPDTVSNRYPDAGEYKVSLLTIGKFIDPVSNDTLSCSYRVEKEISVAEGLLAKFKINRNGEKLTIAKEGYGPSQRFRLYSLQGNRKFLSVIQSNKEIPVSQHGAGDYEVCMTVGNGSCEDSVCHQFWYAPIGVSDPDASNIHVFPNPGQGMLALQLPKTNQKHFQLDIMNSTGKRVFSQGLGTGESRIDLTGQPDGIYFLRLMSANEVYEMKYVKQ